LNKKTLALVIAAVFLTTLLFSCAELGFNTDPSLSLVEKPGGESGSSSVKYTDLTAEEWLANLEDDNFGGYTFTIATSKPYRFYPEEEMTGMVNPALEKRNALVAEKYNVVIKEVYYEESSLQAALSDAVLAGKQFSDLVSVSMPVMSTLAAAGRLLNLFSLPFFDVTAEYLNTSAIKNSAIGDYLYAIYDQASFYEEDFWCVFYNESLLPQKAGEDITKAVRDGTWSWDMLLSYAETAAKDVMDKRSPDLRKDIFGIGSYASSADLYSALFASSGNFLFGDTFHKKAAYSLAAGTGDAVAAKIKEVVKNKSYLSLSGEEASSAFLDGRTAFFVYRVGFANAVAATNLVWGISPLPKVLEGQEKYFSYVGPTSAGISVPVHQSNSARTGKVLNALCAASYLNIEEALKTNYITFCLRDNDSAITLSEIFKNPAINVGTIYSEGYERVSLLTRETISEAITAGDSFNYLYMTNASALKSLNETDFK